MFQNSSTWTTLPPTCLHTFCLKYQNKIIKLTYYHTVDLSNKLCSISDLFLMQLKVNKCSILTFDWIQTSDLWYWKWPHCQLSPNRPNSHCLSSIQQQIRVTFMYSAGLFSALILSFYFICKSWASSRTEMSFCKRSDQTKLSDSDIRSESNEILLRDKAFKRVCSCH